MPHRRTFVAGLGAGLTGLVSPVAGRPAADHHADTTGVDVVHGIDTVARVSDRVTGHLDFAALETLRETDLESLDRRTAADLDRRLAPVLARGPSRVAGLRTLAGDLDAGAAASRLGPGVSAEGTRLLADLALDEAAARPADPERFDADAVTAVAVAEEELGAVESFVLGVDVDGSFRARVRGEEASVADARGVLHALGLPASIVDGLPPVARDDWVEFHGSFEARDGRQPFILALLVVLLAAVIGTFVLGLGDSSPQQRVPQVSFSFEFDTEGHAVIQHRGGDHVDANRLLVDYRSGGTRRRERWRDADGTVEAGDSYRTRARVDSGSRLRVVWTSDDGSTSATIAAATAPN